MATDLLTPRLRLRRMDARDAGLYRALYTSAAVMAQIGPPLSVDAADAAFACILRHDALPAPGHRYWTLEDRCGAGALGIVALQRRGREAELGAMLVPDAWNRRFASEAFGPVLDHAFGAMGLVLVDAHARSGAHAGIAWRLLAPFGFRPAPPRRAGFARWVLSPARHPPVVPENT